MAKRLQRIGVERYKNAFELTMHPDVLEAPLSWKTPKVIFVNSNERSLPRKYSFKLYSRHF